MNKHSKHKPKMPIDDNPSQEERIRQRAYELYEASGQEDGRDIENWLQAEAEIKSLKARSAKR